MKRLFFLTLALAAFVLYVTPAIPTKAADTFCCYYNNSKDHDCSFTTQSACTSFCDEKPGGAFCAKQQATPPGGSSGAQSGTFGPADTQEFNFTNPLQCDDATCLVKRFVDQLNKIAIGLLIIIIFWSAIQFAIAYPTGNEKQIDSAKKTLLYAAIGYTIILLAKGATDIIDSIFK